MGTAFLLETVVPITMQHCIRLQRRAPMGMYEMTKQSQLVEGLRGLADWIESLDHEDDSDIIVELSDVEIMAWHYGERDEFVALTKAMPNPIVKHANDYSFRVRHLFSERVRVTLSAPRDEVCTAKPTGEVETTVSYDVPDEVREQYKVERTQPVVEWDCEPLR